MENFYKNLQELAYLEHQKARDELIRAFDDGFQKNWSYLSQSIIFQG